MLQHFAAGTGVAPHHDGSGADIGAEGLGEGTREVGGEKVADHAADARDADLQLMDAAHTP
ncbi:MAG: hypothetical protein QM757_21995 [Paludibaculum sp.]